MTYTTNMRSPKGKPAPNQFLITDGSMTTFQSYDSVIATWDSTNQMLALKDGMWDYSATTRKYFKQFINGITTLYYDNDKQWRNFIKNSCHVVVLE